MKEALDLALSLFVYSTGFILIAIGISSLVAAFAFKTKVDEEIKDNQRFNQMYNTPKETATNVPATV